MGLELLLEHTAVSEEQFLGGEPISFVMPRPNMPDAINSLTIVVAVYEDGRILVEASTYLSLKQHREQLQRASVETPVEVIDPIVIEDFNQIRQVLDDIRDKFIITRPLDDKFGLKRAEALK